MTKPPRIQPSLLGRMNERQVLRTLQQHGPLSRAEVARRLGLSAPTVSKAVATLLRSGLLEETDAAEAVVGRPAARLRLATSTAQVLGVVIDADHCQIVTAGLDGQIHDDRRAVFATPATYAELLAQLEGHAGALVGRAGVATQAVGLSMPGLIDHRSQRGVLSPNVPITNGHAPGLDLGRLLGVPVALVQESHGLCLAERQYGDARGLDHFAMLDVSVGVGLGVVSGGRLLKGHSGLAGEVGHITVVAEGRACGCGNQGCLETVASDTALAHRASRRLGRKVDIEEVIRLARSGAADLTAELEETAQYLAIGVAAVIHMFNPSTLFLHGRMFEADDRLFERVIEAARRRTLPPAFKDCRIVRARGCKRQGAVAAAVQHLTSAIGPALEM